jgi:hypothetical protein
MSTLSNSAYSFDRDVVFKATDGSGSVLVIWTVPVHFTNDTGTGIASGPYTLTFVPSAIAALSAKTDWSLRTRTALTLDGDGQAAADLHLKAGDLNGTNAVNILDYSILKDNWLPPQGPAGDINGDGIVGSLDYSLMKDNWFTAGDPE